MTESQSKSTIYLGMGLMGTTGLAMGWVVHSPLLMAIAGVLGLVIGGFIGWAADVLWSSSAWGFCWVPSLDTAPETRISSSSPLEAEAPSPDSWARKSNNSFARREADWQ